MNEPLSSRTWVMRSVYVVVCLGIVFFQLLPLETTPRRFAGPDLILVVTFVWALRRPDYVPAFLVGAIALLCDMLFQRPPGLMAALVVIATQALKRRSNGLRDQGFPVEWLTIASIMTAVVLVNRLVLATLLIPQSALGLSIMQLVMSIIAYPFVVMLTHAVFGVRKISPGEVDSLGHRL